MRIIIAVTVLAAVGVVTAFAASQVPSHQAGAAPRCQDNQNPPRCTPTATPAPTPTAIPTATASPTPTPAGCIDFTASPVCLPPPVQTREDQIDVFWASTGFQIGSVQYMPLGAPYL